MNGLFVLAIAVAMTPVQAADWSRAGGALFAGVPVAERDVAARITPAAQVVEVRAPLEPYAAAIDAAARAHGLDPKLLHALVIVESAYQARARSSAGAEGLSQLMVGTATEHGFVDRFDPLANVTGGASYLAAQIVRFGDLRLALAAYNAGPGRVLSATKPPGAATQAYVATVIDCYLALSAGRSPRSSSDCRQRLPGESALKTPRARG